MSQIKINFTSIIFYLIARLNYIWDLIINHSIHGSSHRPDVIVAISAQVESQRPVGWKWEGAHCICILDRGVFRRRPEEEIKVEDASDRLVKYTGTWMHFEFLQKNENNLETKSLQCFI